MEAIEFGSREIFQDCERYLEACRGGIVSDLVLEVYLEMIKMMPWGQPDSQLSGSLAYFLVGGKEAVTNEELEHFFTA